MTTIYWFSGTGNSLAVARGIAGELDEATLEPIARHRAGRVAVEGAVGIVCPVYFYGLPLVVRGFLDRLDASRASYVFVVLTAGGALDGPRSKRAGACGVRAETPMRSTR